MGKNDPETAGSSGEKTVGRSGIQQEQSSELELLYNTSESHKKVAIAIAQMWKQALGVKVNMRNEEWKTFHSKRQQL